MNEEIIRGKIVFWDGPTYSKEEQRCIFNELVENNNVLCFNEICEDNELLQTMIYCYKDIDAYVIHKWDDKEDLYDVVTKSYKDNDTHDVSYVIWRCDDYEDWFTNNVLIYEEQLLEMVNIYKKRE